jgi:hypothetical protein
MSSRDVKGKYAVKSVVKRAEWNYIQLEVIYFLTNRTNKPSPQHPFIKMTAEY